MATAIQQPPATQVAVHGTGVTKGKILKFVIIIILIAAVFTAFTLWWNHRPTSYNLRNTKYGKALVIEIKPGEMAEVELTNDWCPFWSDGALNVHDDEGGTYVLEGFQFTQFNTGKPQGRMNMNWKFKNKNKVSITLKIGRCKSKSDCSIKFEQN